jgi:hypothetical protein
MRAHRATKWDEKQALIAILSLDRMAQTRAQAIEVLQRKRMAQGLTPSQSKNPLLDKPLPIPIEE